MEVRAGRPTIPQTRLRASVLARRARALCSATTRSQRSQRRHVGRAVPGAVGADVSGARRFISADACSLRSRPRVFWSGRYIVFHDCTHGSFLPSKRANAWLGTTLGLLTFSDVRVLAARHLVHHATAGDLDRRGVGDVPTKTVAEYHALSARGRLAYRLFRNPLVMFGIGPIVALIIQPRIVPRTAPVPDQTQRPRDRCSYSRCWSRDALCWLIRWQTYLLVQLPTLMLSGRGGHLAVLRSAPVRRRLLGDQRSVELPRRRLAGQLIPEAPEGAAVLLGQHRPAPRAPPQRADPELQPPARPRRDPDLPTTCRPCRSWTACAP